MFKWIPCELHTHTQHSDGNFSVLALAIAAKEIGLEWIALTDHNTISGQMEIDFAMNETGIKIIPGLEWTAFYGHMVAMGITNYVDWRNMGPGDIHTGIKKVHNQGGLVGITHPFRIGSPMCTGCYWQFDVSNWNDIDYLEVWSELFPSSRDTNLLAFDMWTDILNKGHKLTAVSGRDWHRGVGVDKPIAVTYLGINIDEKNDYISAAKNALSNGHAGVTLGPLLILSAMLKSTSKTYIIGEELEITNSSETIEISIIIDFNTRKDFYNFIAEPLTLALMSNEGKIIEMQIVPDSNIDIQTICVKGLTWIRGELYGSIDGITVMIAFTNPIYIKHI